MWWTACRTKHKTSKIPLKCRVARSNFAEKLQISPKNTKKRKKFKPDYQKRVNMSDDEVFDEDGSMNFGSTSPAKSPKKSASL